jgi:ABC-type Mn2+/Zn2+ transport system ATPase subunit
MTCPLLELKELRLERNSRTVLDATNLVSSGDRIGLLGEGRQVMAAFYGEATVTSGSFLVCGVELEQARRCNLFGLARPWPRNGATAYPFTVREGLTLSAMLASSSETDARRRSDAALSQLGLSHFGNQRLGQRLGLEHYLAGLAEAALFESEVLVVDWPLGTLTAEGWARYGTALSRLLTKRRWLAWVSGPARLPVEQAWLGALDQLFLLDGELAVGIVPGTTHFVRTLLVLAATPAEVEQSAESLGLKLEPVGLRVAEGDARAAFVVELPKDEFGRPETSVLLEWCDRHQLAIDRLEPLDTVC